MDQDKLDFAPNASRVFDARHPAATEGSAKRSRACLGCREQKSRCDLRDQSSRLGCQRCSRAGRKCIVPPPTKHKPRSTGKTRVEVLEKRVDALVAKLAGARRGSHSENEERSPELQIDTIGTSFDVDGSGISSSKSIGDLTVDSPLTASSLMKDGTGKRPQVDTYKSVSFFLPKPSRREELFNKDVVNQGLLSIADAERVYHRFLYYMLPHLPLIALPVQIKVSDLRKTKPSLFLVIMTVASAILGEEQQEKLVRESTRSLADRIMIRGEKDLDLIQALQIFVTWYPPPEKYEEVKIYLFIHMAGTMALELRYGEHQQPSLSKLSSLGLTTASVANESPEVSTDTVSDRQRAWLSCYFLSGYISMLGRRPPLLRWTPYMESCMVSLSEGSNALDSDKLLCQFVRGQHIAEDIGANLPIGDPSKNLDGVDTKLQYILPVFEQQIERWKAQIPLELLVSLRSFIGVINLYLHEIFLHAGHNTHDFRPPFLEETLPSPSSFNESRNVSLSTQFSSIATCIVSAQSVLDNFLDHDTEIIYSLPIFFFIRTVYAAFALVRISVMAGQPNNDFNMIDEENLKTEAYIIRMLDCLRGIIETKRMRIASPFYLVLQLMYMWLQKQTQANSQSSKESNIQQQCMDRPYSRQAELERADSRIFMNDQMSDNAVPWEIGALVPGMESVLEYSGIEATPDADFAALFDVNSGKFFETALGWFTGTV